MEDVLLRLLVPDSTIILQATNDLKNILKDPGINVALCHCLASCPNIQVRQYAAVLLRRKMAKAKNWKKLPLQMKQGLKQAVLEAYIKEPEKVVRASIAQLIASLAKYELPGGTWPELLMMLNQFVQSTNINEKENGLIVLSAVTSVVGSVLKPHLKSLLSMLSKSLQDSSSKNIPFYTIKCLTHLVRCIGTEEMNIFQTMIPFVMAVIKKLASTDEELACEAMEIFDELVESEVAIIVPHIKPLIGLCLEIAANQSFEDNIRVKAMSIISWLTRLKKKTILKHKLVPLILEVLFPIMCQPSENEDDNDSDDECDENQSPSLLAAQVIDVMALHLPPEKLIQPLMHHVEPALTSNNPYHKKAAYLALAVIAEGCSEYIRNRCLQSYLEVICQGISEPNTIVRNAALYCLGQYAEFLQPEISEFAPNLLPVLCEYLSQTCQVLQQGEKDPPSLSKTFYALESFCENLEGALLPYLPVLMEKLMTFLTSTKSVNAQELAISAIGAVASAAKESIVPYFIPIIGKLKCYITEKQSDSNMTLQIQALDTLGILVRTVGVDTSMPIAHDCMRLGLELLLKTDDPDLRKCIYGLFASLSTVLKEEMTQYLPTIVEYMLNSMQSTEGVLPQYAQEEEDIGFTIFEDLEDSEDEEEISLDDSTDDQDDEDDEEITGYSVENSYLEEKEDCCIALKEIAENVRIGFIPYLDRCFEEVKKLLENPGLEVRRSAVSALGQFCITLCEISQELDSLEYRAALEKALLSFLPKLFATAREDTERQVVLACFDTLSEMLEKIKVCMLNSNPMLLEMITTLIKDAFKHKLACQDEDDEYDELEDNGKAEYDGMLEEYAADIIPILAKIVPSHQFSACFAGLLVFLLPNTKKTCSVSDKSFAIGTLAEVVHSMQLEASRPFFTRLLPVFLGGMKDDHEEVRSNAVYGLGVLVENAADISFPHYPELLQALSNMFSQEDNARARDNLCSTVARLIMTNANGVPLNQVFPVYLQCLPLQEDLEENFTVYKCLLHLYNIRHQELFQNLPQILKTISVALTTQKIDDETKAVIGQLIRGVHSEYPNDFGTVLESLSPENAQALRSAVTT